METLDETKTSKATKILQILSFSLIQHNPLARDQTSFKTLGSAMKEDDYKKRPTYIEQRSCFKMEFDLMFSNMDSVKTSCSMGLKCVDKTLKTFNQDTCA